MHPDIRAVFSRPIVDTVSNTYIYLISSRRLHILVEEKIEKDYIQRNLKTDVVLDVVAIVPAVHVLITSIIVDLRSDFKSDINVGLQVV